MKRFFALCVALVLMLLMTGCSIPVVRDLVGSENSLGKTNNTAVTIATAMDEYLKNKKKGDLILYGVEMILNSDSNGAVLLYYSAALPETAEYSDIYVAEVDSKTGHVERFSTAKYATDGITPFRLVKDGYPLDVGALPVDSGKVISAGTKVFSRSADFHYDYIELCLSAPEGLEQYEIRFISMLNDAVYSCTVDAVSGTVLMSTTDTLK